MKKGVTTKFRFLRIIGKIFLPLLIIIFPFLLIAFAISPNLFSRLIRIFFNYQFKVPPKEFLYTESVSSIADIHYGDSADEVFDLHLPSKREGVYPLIDRKSVV